MTEARDELVAIRNDLEALRSDVAKLLGTARSEGCSRAEELASRMVEAARDWQSCVSDALDETCRNVREGGQVVLDRSREKIRSHPLAIVGGSLLAGALAGYLLRRR